MFLTPVTRKYEWHTLFGCLVLGNLNIALFAKMAVKWQCSLLAVHSIVTGSILLYIIMFNQSSFFIVADKEYEFVCKKYCV